MCSICDHRSIDDHFENLKRMVDTHGWAVQFVEADPPLGPGSWGYTTGLTSLCGSPELLVAGLAPEPTARLLNQVAHHVAHGYAVGEACSHLGGTSLLPVPVHASHFEQSDRFAGWKGYYERFGPPPPWSATQILTPALTTAAPNLFLPLAGAAPSPSERRAGAPQPPASSTARSRTA